LKELDDKGEHDIHTNSECMWMWR